MADYNNSFSLTGIAAALAECMGIEAPACAEEANKQLTGLVKETTGKVDRVFMYNPDAIALWLYQKYTALFDDVVRHTRLSLPLRAVMPSVTPVCFGTMYTGAMPAVHGIRSYEKPVIRIDTLFDALLRAGKKVAIVCDEQCSLGRIFMERDMDYFRYQTIGEINEKAMELIAADNHDFIAVYHENYDSTMHKTGPESPESLTALAANVAAFDRFAREIKARWKDHDTLIGFAMDHGCHEIDGNCGSHGLDMPEDLNILHHYGVFPRK